MAALDAGAQGLFETGGANDAAFVFRYALAAIGIVAKGAPRDGLAVVVHEAALLGDW
jgi:hypothetical protein